MAVDQHARFTALRHQAAQVLADGGTSLDAGNLNTTDLARLMEELCIYHEELKIQNDELAIIHTRADSARAHYQTLFNLLPLPVMLVDSQGAVVEDNDVSQDWLGPSRRFHHQDMRLTQALDRLDRPRVLRLLQSLEPTRKGQLADQRIGRDARTPHDRVCVERGAVGQRGMFGTNVGDRRAQLQLHANLLQVIG